MRIQRLKLENFRGFASLDLALHERLTVLVGINGSGKSSILEAIRLILTEAYSLRITTGHPWGGAELRPTDIREGTGAAKLSLSVRGPGDKGWTYSRPYWAHPSALSPLRGAFEEDNFFTEDGENDENPSDYFSACYSVRRALLEEKADADSGHDVLDRWAAFKNIFDLRGSLQSFVTWFRAREDVENERRLREDSTFRDRQLQAVRDAVTSVMGGYENLFVQRHPRETMVLSKHGHRLELHQLSDGEKCLLAMVGDIARRMAMVAREGQNPLEVEAVVMIDEIELHLHPRWQREVVPALLRTFPRCQLLLTTHSPQVLSSVARESIFILDDFKVYPATSPAKGRDSTSILVDLMGLPEHPGEVAERLHTIARLLDEDQLDQARSAIDALAADLGDDDREILRLRSLLGFLEG